MQIRTVSQLTSSPEEASRSMVTQGHMETQSCPGAAWPSSTCLGRGLTRGQVDSCIGSFLGAKFMTEVKVEINQISLF